MSTERQDMANRCSRLIDTLDIPEPFDTTVFLNQLARKRGKKIRLLSGNLGADQLCGLVVSTPAVDYIYYANNVPPFQARHTVLHEVGHLLFDHQTPSRDDGTWWGNDESLARLLLPTLSPSLVQRILGRTNYASAHERQAEMFASIFLSQFGFTHRSTSNWGLPSDAAKTRGNVEQPIPSDLRASSWKTSTTRHLKHMWKQLTTQVPEVVLGDPKFGSLATAELARYRLYRRVLEIRDAQLALRRFTPPAVRGWVLACARERSLDPIATDILLEASELGAALDAHHARRPQQLSFATLPHSQATPDLFAEANWLHQVAISLSRDPVVTAVRRRANVTAPQEPPGNAP